MAAVKSSEIPHNPEQARSYQNLEAARKLASENHGYDSASMCKQLKDAFRIRTEGREPFKWQLDAAEAFLLGLDCLIVAGTGAGKTLEPVQKHNPIRKPVQKTLKRICRLMTSATTSKQSSNSPLLRFRVL